MSASEVTRCVEAITQLELAAKASIQDIHRSAGLSGGQSASGDGSMNQLIALNATCRRKMAEMKEKLDTLRTLAWEQDREDDKQLILADLVKYETQLTRCHHMLREATHLAQLRLHQSERDALLTHSTVNNATSREGAKHGAKSKIAASAGNITESLLSVSRVLAEGVSSSQDTLSSLANSSQVIGSTQEEMRATKGQIQSSGVLLTKYKRRQLTDKLIILLALAFFLACVLYILKKRLLPSWLAW